MSTYRWLEFIDVEVAGDYVPQCDVSSPLGQVIKTWETQLTFPVGVAVEEFKVWNGRKKLKERIPIRVEKMLDKYDLHTEYDKMVDHFIEKGVCSVFEYWKTSHIKKLVEVHKPAFSAKGVDLFVSKRTERIGWASESGGYLRYYRWIEFVDRELQPNYTPKPQEDNCTIM